MSLSAIPQRALYALGALVPAALLASGYYLQYFQGQDPCPLCHVQRAFYYAVGAVFLVAALHGPGRAGGIVYSVFGFLFALGGAGVATRHVWLQHLPPDKVPACGPDLLYMIENLPFSRTLEKLFSGSGQCAEVKWRFLGLSIPEWSLIWFGALALYAIWLAARPRRA